MVGQEKGTVTSTIRGRLGHRSTMTVDTDAAEAEHLAYSRSQAKSQYTPRTEASTPNSAHSPGSSYGTTPAGQRGRTDIRSPGVDQTPANDGAQAKNLNDNSTASTSGSNPQASTPIPNFITQTDKYGNASTPRTPISSSDSDKPEYPHSDEDACDTLLDSLRMMCCCLTPEASDSKSVDNNTYSTPTQSQGSVDKNNSAGDEGSSLTSHIKLLPKIHPDDAGKKCLVLDLDETLVHSSFRAVPGADFVIPVQIEDVVHFVYVSKRPGVDQFLVEMAKYYEIIIYTASLNKYADPLLDLLDPHKTIRSRLFRESCVYYEGNYVKDLSILDRDLTQSIIVDNSPASYIFHPENAIDCSSYIDDPKDRELDQIGAFLKGVKDAKDMRGVAPMWREWPNLKYVEGVNDGGNGDDGSLVDEPLDMDKYAIEDEAGRDGAVDWREDRHEQSPR